MKTIHSSSKGFTIIEVSLVLAIAGLIFLMIFVALPALQRQARDTERREDTLAFINAIKKYQQNNRGELPKTDFKNEEFDWTNSTSWNGPITEDNTWAPFYNEYLGDNFTSPEGGKYRFWLMQCSKTECTDYYLGDFNDRPTDWYIFIGSTCKNDEPSPSSNPRNLSVLIKLESGGAYCANT